MSRIKIENGRIVDPANGIDAIGSLYISGGKIVAVGAALADFDAEQTIDAAGQVVCPGFVDLSVRLREPGQTQKGNIQSETRAALAAGVTSLCLPPDTKPCIDTPAVVEYIKDKAEQAGYAQVYSIGALTQRLDGNELSTMFALKQAGCIAVGNASAPLGNLLILRRAMEYASSHNLLLMFRANEASLSGKGCAHEGAVASRYGLPGIPEAAESIALAQCLELAELTGCRVHFSQISCKQSVIKIQQAKKYGLNVTADVAIHQLHLTENDIEPFDSNYHVMPPLRAAIDRQYLREALANGTVDAICSDHQPHDLDAKLGAFRNRIRRGGTGNAAAVDAGVDRPTPDRFGASPRRPDLQSGADYGLGRRYAGNRSERRRLYFRPRSGLAGRAPGLAQRRLQYALLGARVDRARDPHLTSRTGGLPAAATRGNQPGLTSVTVTAGSPRQGSKHELHQKPNQQFRIDQHYRRFEGRSILAYFSHHQRIYRGFRRIVRPVRRDFDFRLGPLETGASLLRQDRGNCRPAQQTGLCHHQRRRAGRDGGGQ